MDMSSRREKLYSISSGQDYVLLIIICIDGVFYLFRSVISYKVTHQPFFSTETISSSGRKNVGFDNM